MRKTQGHIPSEGHISIELCGSGKKRLYYIHHYWQVRSGRAGLSGRRQAQVAAEAAPKSQELPQ
jgi:hypothetical protein